MSRLLPSTLSGRLTLTLLIGLLAAQLIGAAILLRDRASVLYQTGGISAAQRIASAVSALDRLDPDTRRLLLPALNTVQMRVTLDPAPLPPTEEDFRADFLQAHLRRLLADSRPIRVALAAPAPPTAGYSAWHRPHTMRMPPFGDGSAVCRARCCISGADGAEGRHAHWLRVRSARDRFRLARASATRPRGSAPLGHRPHLSCRALAHAPAGGPRRRGRRARA